MWRISRCGMWSLGHFTDMPSDENLFEDTFQHWLGVRLRAWSEWHFRPPEHMWSMRNDVESTWDENSSMNWHQDGAEHRYLGTWSNTIGTEIMLGTEKEYRSYFGVPSTKKVGQIYQPEPFEVVLFDNTKFVHRIPNGLKRKSPEVQKRWFVRFSTKSPVLDHPDVRECVL